MNQEIINKIKKNYSFGLFVTIFYVVISVSLSCSRHFTENISFLNSLSFLALATRIMIWVLIIDIINKLYVNVAVRSLILILVGEVLFYFALQDILSATVNNEFTYLLIGAMKQFIIVFALFVIYLFAGRKLMALAEFKKFGLFVTFLLAPAMLLYIYQFINENIIVTLAFDVLRIIPYLILSTSFYKLHSIEIGKESLL